MGIESSDQKERSAEAVELTCTLSTLIVSMIDRHARRRDPNLLNRSAAMRELIRIGFAAVSAMDEVLGKQGEEAGR